MVVFQYVAAILFFNTFNMQLRFCPEQQYSKASQLSS